MPKKVNHLKYTSLLQCNKFNNSTAVIHRKLMCDVKLLYKTRMENTAV